MFTTERALEVAKELLADDSLSGICKITIEVRVMQTLVWIYDANGENPVAVGSDEGLDKFYCDLIEEAF